MTGGSSGTGNGTVSYTVAANTSTTARTGTLTIAGLTATVTQAGACLTRSRRPRKAWWRRRIVLGGGHGDERLCLDRREQ